MKIYIATSWKNQHAAEMLTDLLQEKGHTVNLFTRHSRQERDVPDFEEWVTSEAAEACFEYDTTHAMMDNIVIYIGPSGTDAWAEVGAAFGRGVPILALNAKGEPSGLMRKMIYLWFDDYKELLEQVEIMKTPEDKNHATND